MPVDSESNDSPSSGLTKVQFAKSVPMVTIVYYFAYFIPTMYMHVFR